MSARGEEAAGKPANSRREGGGWEAGKGTGRRGGGLGGECGEEEDNVVLLTCGSHRYLNL